ncbi:MAG: hypothetical protein GXP29_06280 [Planctomycetes bacterium]|nr:hypothetical protein [Planctomycetota bacterium]
MGDKRNFDIAGVIAVCVIAAIPLVASAQESVAGNGEDADQRAIVFDALVVSPQQPSPPPAHDHWSCTVLKSDAQLRGVYAANLWLNNTVPYAFHANTSPSQQADALNAMSLVEGISSMNFVARTTEADYVIFQDAGGNSSFIGRIGGAQMINISNWSTAFVIVHEIMHAMGVFHEQSRSDRDTFVQINSANICQNCCSGGPCDGNFDIAAGASIVGPYDFESVMHYGQCFFSSCANCSANPGACSTITVLPPNDVMWQNLIGQSTHFSAGDILTIQTMYPSLSVPCESVIGDLDNDSDSDLADAAIFQSCYNASTGGRPECSCADQNVDEFVDAADVEAFINAIHGPDTILGACCGDGDGVCTEGTASECAMSGGTYQGDGIACVDVNCPVDAPGACCDPTDLSCSETSDVLCAAGGGIYKGNGTTCNGASCPVEYSNTSTSTTLFGPGANIEFADDFTLAGTARNMAYYDLTVFGQGITDYSATVSLYTACPGAGGTLIAGTTRTFNNIANFQESVLSATFDPAITIPDTVWMVVSLNGANTSWVIGREAETGSTTNNFAVDQSPWSCNFTFGGGIWGGFRSTILCID